MGWDFGVYSMKEMKKQSREAIIKMGAKLIAEKTEGRNWWRVIELKNGERIISLHLTKQEKRYGQTWTGYKALTESMGPCEVNCPLEFLAMVPEPNSQYSKQWREEVRQYHAKKQAKIIQETLDDFNYVGSSSHY